MATRISNLLIAGPPSAWDFASTISTKGWISRQVAT